MPVVGLKIVLELTSGRRSLPEVPIERCGDGSGFADADRLSRIHIPGLRVIGLTDAALVNSLDDLNGVRRGSLLIAHLNELLILLLRLYQKLAFSWIVAGWFLDVDVLAG